MPNPTITAPAAPSVRTAADIEAELSALPKPGDREIDRTDLGGGDAPATSAHSAPTPTPTPVELEATGKGWVPKDQYSGDPAKWVDAATFVKRGERFVKNLEREVSGLKRQLADFEGTRAEIMAFHKELLDKKNGEITALISQLKVQKSEAQSIGDHELAVQLEDRIDVLKDQQKEVKALPPTSTAPPQPTQQTDPILEAWVEDGNEWFRDDSKLRAYALEVGQEIAKEATDAGAPLRGLKFLKAVRARMEEDFPKRFAAPAPTGSPAPAARTSPVSGTSSSSPHSTSSAPGQFTAANLPSEDLALMRLYISKGWTTKEKFLQSYNSR